MSMFASDRCARWPRTPPRRLSERRTELVTADPVGALLVAVDYQTGTLYAIDVGPSGLFLAYGAGSEEPFGLVVDDFSGATVAPANRQHLVHCVCGLVLRDQDAIWRVTGIPYTL